MGVRAFELRRGWAHPSASRKRALNAPASKPCHATSTRSITSKVVPASCTLTTPGCHGGCAGADGAMDSGTEGGPSGGGSAGMGASAVGVGGCGGDGCG